MATANKVALRDYMHDGEQPAKALRRAMEEAGYRNWGIYCNPVEPEGIYPASMDEALGAWSDDPSLVYLTDVADDARD